MENNDLSNESTSNLNPPLENEPVVSSNQAVNSLEAPKKKGHKLVKFLVTILLLCLVGFGGYIGYRQVILGSPVRMFKTAINEGYESFSEALKEAKKNSLDYDVLKDSIMTSGEFSVKVDGLDLGKDAKGVIDVLNSINFKYEFGFDPASKNLQVGLGLKEDGKDLISGNVYLKDNVLYAESKAIFDKTINVGSIDDLLENGDLEIRDFDYEKVLEEIAKEFGLSKDLVKNLKMPEMDYDKLDEIAKIVKDSLIESLEKENCNKDKTTIEINGKDVNVTENSYKITDKVAKKMYKAILESLINDEKFASNVSVLTGIDKSDVKDILRTFKDDANFSDMEDVVINIYTKGLTNKIVGFNLTYDGEEILVYKMDKDYKELLIGDSKNGIKVVSEKEDEAVATLTVNKEKIATITVTKKDEYTTDIKLNINYDDYYTELKLSMAFSIYCKKINDHKMESKLTVNFKTTNDDEEMSFELKFDNTTSIKADIANVDTSNSVKLDSLTEKDFTKALENLQSVLKDTKLGELVDQFLEGNNDDDWNEGWNDDWDDDWDF